MTRRPAPTTPTAAASVHHRSRRPLRWKPRHETLDHQQTHRVRRDQPRQRTGTATTRRSGFLLLNTQLQAEVFLREIKFICRTTLSCSTRFGKFSSESKWTDREIVVGPRTTAAKEATVTCVGVGGPVASRHYDLIIADDIVDEENARTEVQREKTKTWYYKTLVPCLEPHGRLFLLGTRYHYLDLYGHLIRNELAEKHQIIRAIEADGSDALAGEVLAGMARAAPPRHGERDLRKPVPE